MNPYLKHVSRIEFVVTLACTGRCIHCQNGEDLDRTCHIDSDVAKDAIEKICGIYDISSVMTFGGEPLLYPDTICTIHETARNMGIDKRQLITNGYFTKSKDHARDIAYRLADAGVNNLLISADAFHQETIPLDRVAYFAQAATKAGIPVTISPAWLVSKSDLNPYNYKTHAIVNELSSIEGVHEGNGNVIFPAGNALKYLSEYFNLDETPIDPYVENPFDLHTISFGANGDVLDGKVYETDITEIVERNQPL